MIFYTLPTMLLGLLPIILVETGLALRDLKIPFQKLLKGTAVANLMSTVIGIPVAWFLLVVVQMTSGGGFAYGLSTHASRFLAITWQAPWLIPYEGEFYWMIPAATLALLIPFFFASWWVEYVIMKRIFGEIDKRLLSRVVRNANFISYSGLAVYVLVRIFFR